MLYWCFSYGAAFKFALYYVISVACNALLKMFIKRPRPWMASGDVINKLPASGFSFPSGHSQSIASITTFLTYNIYKTKTKNGIKFIEINPRFGGGAPISIKAGANSPKYLYQLLIGEALVYHEEFEEGILGLRYDEAVFLNKEGKVI